MSRQSQRHYPRLGRDECRYQQGVQQFRTRGCTEAKEYGAGVSHSRLFRQESQIVRHTGDTGYDIQVLCRLAILSAATRQIVGSGSETSRYQPIFRHRLRRGIAPLSDSEDTAYHRIHTPHRRQKQRLRQRQYRSRRPAQRVVLQDTLLMRTSWEQSGRLSRYGLEKASCK